MAVLAECPSRLERRQVSDVEVARNTGRAIWSMVEAQVPGQTHI
jgi:hypothetical protein